MPNRLEVVLIVVMLAALAVSVDRINADAREAAAWREFATTHQCWQVDAHMWKCELPTPTYWHRF